MLFSVNCWLISHSNFDDRRDVFKFISNEATRGSSCNGMIMEPPKGVLINIASNHPRVSMLPRNCYAFYTRFLPRSQQQMHPVNMVGDCPLAQHTWISSRWHGNRVFSHELRHGWPIWSDFDRLSIVESLISMLN